MSSSVRQRAPKSSDASPAAPSPGARVKTEDKYNPFSLIEIGRIITLLFLISCISSWFVTKKDFFWGHRPPYTKLGFWQGLAVGEYPPSSYKGSNTFASFKRGPLQLTPLELKRYDGSDPSLPLYLAINGTIYDVSNGRHFYGPGGSYASFGGADGTRAFVTGCFAEDITPDLRGVELMYLPEDNPEIDSQYSSGALKKLKEQERRYAKTQVEASVKHWIDFFANSPKYTKVGTVKKGGAEGPPPPLCQKAQDGRPKRREPLEAQRAKTK